MRYFAKLDESSFRIELISISCFWHSLVGIDENGNADYASIRLVRHARAKQRRTNCGRSLTKTKFHLRTGCRFHPSYWPAKLLRLETEEPEAARAQRAGFRSREYLALKFFGETATSVSMASGTGSVGSAHL